MDWNTEEASTAVLYHVEYDTHRPALALVRSWNLEKGANAACIMLNVTQRGKHYHLVWCSAWLKEANTAILCGGEVGTEMQTLSYCIMTMSMTPRQTLPSRVVLTMTQRGKHCHLVWCWLWHREANTAISCGADYDTERQTLLSCVVLNTTERQILM